MILENLLLRCGVKRKYIVLKIEDLLKYVPNAFKLSMLENDMSDIHAGRMFEGKAPDPEYIVINTDEPYIEEIIEVLKRHGHWG